MVVWLDFKKGDIIKKKHKRKTLNLFLQQVLINQSILDSVEISGGFKGQEGVKKQNKSPNC